MSTFERDLYGNPTITFLQPPQVTQEPEMDFNAFVYYKQTNEMTERLRREEVWDIILHPNKKFEAGVVYKMKPSSVVGPLIPAHFPSLSDSLPLHKALKALFACHIANDLPQTLGTLVPPYLMHLIDPKPVLNLEQHEPYCINSEAETLKVCMATFSDAIQIVNLPSFHNVLHLQVFKHNADVIPAHHSLVIDPFSNNYIPEIALISSVPPGTVLACWNVRDVGRMSFHSNFLDLFEICKPALVVLFETGNTVHNLSEIVPRLPGNYTFSHSNMDSLSGGVALLWRWKVLYCQTRFQGHGQGHHPLLDIIVKGNSELCRMASGGQSSN